MNQPSGPKILFSGTPEIAAFILEKLILEGKNVIGVITAPDKPAGRGLLMRPVPVKEIAIKYGLPLFQPERLKNPEFLDEISKLKPDLGIVVAFRMMPEALWALPEMGTFNLHASLLPAYRGAAPINRAIMAGEKESGLTTFLLKQEIDTGNILLQKKMEIGDNETAGSLYNRMMHEGSGLVLETIEVLASGIFRGHPQEDRFASPAPKIFREDMRINPHELARNIHNQIRGLQPHPAAFLEWEGKFLKIHESLQTNIKITPEEEGRLLQLNKKLYLACSDQYLEILKIQPEGKRIMSAQEFLAGHKI